MLDDATHGTLTLAPDGGFTYTPDANFNGEDTFTYNATDGTLESNTATVTITVSPVNDAPVANSQLRSVDEDDVLTTTLSGSDVEAGPLTFAVAVPPTHGTVNLTGASAVYTPAPDYCGPDSFTFTVSDGSLTSAPATVSIVVNPIEEFTQWLELQGFVGPHPVMIPTATPSAIYSNTSSVVIRRMARTQT